jgi:hypothetical protein
MHARPFLATAMLSLSILAACSANVPEEESGYSDSALTAAGGTTRLAFLGSSAFLMQCAGGTHTLGCGRPVMSVPNSTPYFSAPRTWSRSTCNEYFTFRLGGRCVEAQRLEVSDHRNFIEGNPGLFDALGLAHSDGTHCGGSGQADGVTVTPGRHCAESAASNGASGGAKSAGNDSKAEDEPPSK